MIHYPDLTPVNIIFSMLVHNTLSQILGKKRRDRFFKRYGKARHGDESKRLAGRMIRVLARSRPASPMELKYFRGR